MLVSTCLPGTRGGVLMCVWVAGVPKPFVEAFKHGIPPAYEVRLSVLEQMAVHLTRPHLQMLVGIAPSILSTAPPQSPLILPGTSLPPSPARAPSLSFSATHDHLLPDTLDSDDELLPPSLFDLATCFSRKDGAICTRKELYESFVRPKRPTEDALELEVLPGAFTPDRDEGHDEDADYEAEQGAQADSKYRPPTPPGSNALLTRPTRSQGRTASTGFLQPPPPHWCYPHSMLLDRRTTSTTPRRPAPSDAGLARRRVVIAAERRGGRANT